MDGRDPRAQHDVCVGCGAECGVIPAERQRKRETGPGLARESAAGFPLSLRFVPEARLRHVTWARF
jgi:hypothetical protein